MRERELRMSQREMHRVHVVRLTMEGRETVGRGAKLLGISPRQIKRLRRKFKERGMEGLLHGNRGKAPWNKTVAEKIKQVVELARGRYQGLNDSHLTEKLKEKEQIAVSRPVVRTILRQAGIAAVRKRGVKRHYKRRERKAQEGALLLWDGSPHYLVRGGARRIQSDGSDRRRHWSLIAWGLYCRGGRPELFDLLKANPAGQRYTAGIVHGSSRDFPP